MSECNALKISKTHLGAMVLYLQFIESNHLHFSSKRLPSSLLPSFNPTILPPPSPHLATHPNTSTPLRIPSLPLRCFLSKVKLATKLWCQAAMAKLDREKASRGRATHSPPRAYRATRSRSRERLIFAFISHRSSLSLTFSLSGIANTGNSRPADVRPVCADPPLVDPAPQGTQQY